MFNRRNEFNGRTPENSNFVFASGAHKAVVCAWCGVCMVRGVRMAVRKAELACCACSLPRLCLGSYLPQLQAQPHHSHPAAADPAAPQPLQSTLSPTAAAGAT